MNAVLSTPLSTIFRKFSKVDCYIYLARIGTTAHRPQFYKIWTGHFAKNDCSTPGQDSLDKSGPNSESIVELTNHHSNSIRPQRTTQASWGILLDKLKSTHEAGPLHKHVILMKPTKFQNQISSGIEKTYAHSSISSDPIRHLEFTENDLRLEFQSSSDPLYRKLVDVFIDEQTYEHKESQVWPSPYKQSSDIPSDFIAPSEPQDDNTNENSPGSLHMVNSTHKASGSHLTSSSHIGSKEEDDQGLIKDAINRDFCGGGATIIFDKVKFAKKLETAVENNQYNAIPFLLTETEK